MPITLPVSSAKFAASPGVLPLNTRVMGFSSFPPLARLARVAQKSAAATAPTVANRALFLRSQKGCGAGAFVCTATGVSATSAIEAPPAGMGGAAASAGSREAVSTGSSDLGSPATGVKAAKEDCWASRGPDCASTSARISSRDWRAARKRYLGMVTLVSAPYRPLGLVLSHPLEARERVLKCSDSGYQSDFGVRAGKCESGNGWDPRDSSAVPSSGVGA